MLKANGAVEIRHPGNGEIETINGSDFTTEEHNHRNLGDGDKIYIGTFKYDGKGYELQFQATYIQGYIRDYPVGYEGDIEIVDDNIYAEWEERDDDEEY